MIAAQKGINAITRQSGNFVETVFCGKKCGAKASEKKDEKNSIHEWVFSFLEGAQSGMGKIIKKAVTK